MGMPFFRFGRFRLNPQARELFDGDRRVDLPLSTIDCLIHLIQHRDRPVGRDELAATVWGRVDVSEVSLTHAIMRLRRVLGDTGNDQRLIRTVPRLGYRWVGPIDDAASEETAERPPIEETLPEAAPPEAPRASTRKYFAIAAAALLLIGAAIFLALREPASPVNATAPTPAMVMPVALDAPPESAWVRLGLMDLIATQLRRGGIATAPSESVVALVNARRADAASKATLIVEPAATYSHGAWDLRLDARDAERTLRVEVRADDPVKAGLEAADELLIKLGRTPPPTEAGDLSLAEETLRQRVGAAVLSGQLDVARHLVETAPPALSASPEIALSRAKVEFFAGDYDDARRDSEALLVALKADAPIELRTRVLNTLGAAYFRLGRIDDADNAYAEAIRIAQYANIPDVLAKAYIGSGGVASQRVRLEDAAADYGRARTLLEMSNDAFGVAAVDLNLGMNAMQRGQPAAALPLLRSASERFTKLAGEDALAATLVAIVSADLDLLDYQDALATSERFAPMQAHAGNQRQRWELTLARARALAGVGRLGEADALLARIADASDPAQDAMLRAQANSLSADLSIARGDCAKAAEFAAAGLVPALETTIVVAYAETWRGLVTALHCAGQNAAADAQLTQMRAWSEKQSDEHVHFELALAEADQAAARGAGADALAAYGAAMSTATRRGVPAEIVAVGAPYVRALLAAGHIDEAVSVNGRIAPWADRDPRAAAAEASIYKTLKQSTAADAALERARRLAGERLLSAE